LPVFFHTGSALGIRPSELSPPERFSALLPAEQTRLPFRSSVLPLPKQQAGPTSRGSRAFSRPRVPGQRSGISEPPAGGSLGLRPSRVFPQRPWSNFRPTSSHALRMPDDYSPNTPTPQSLDRPSLRPIPIPRRNADSDRPTLLGFLHRHAPGIQTRVSPWLWVHLSLRRALPPTDQRSSNDSPSYLSCQDRLRC